MRTSNVEELSVEELSLEELEAVNGGFWDGIMYFGSRLWEMCQDVIKKLMKGG